MAMATPTLLAAVVLIYTMSTATLLPVATADAGFVASICNKTHNVDKCVAILSSSPDIGDANTVTDLANIALDLAVAAASDAGGVINHRSGKYDPNSPEGNALRICSGAYLDAANDLDIDAHDSLDAGDYATALKLVAGAAAAADNCEQAFAAGKVGSVMAEDQKMKDRCGVAHDIINLLIPPKLKRVWH